MTSSTIRILLIDDEESDFLMTRALLGQIEEPRMEVEWASEFEEGLTILSEHRHDLCLLDYFLGEETGLDLLKAARSQGVRTPIILLTGKGSREVDLEAMKAGAVDYLQKGVTEPEPMERAIRYAVERHRAQEELRRSEERHRGMFDHLPLGLFRVSAEGEHMEANPALIRILEHPDRDTIRRDYAHNYFVSPADRERFFETLTDQSVALGFQSRLRTASGRPIRVRNTARVHRGPGGRIEYIEGTVEDVTGRQPPEGLEDEAAAFRALLRDGPLEVAVADVEGRVRGVSRGLRELLARSSSELEGAPVWDLFHPDASTDIARALEEVAEGDMDRTGRKVRLIDGEGRIVWCRATALPVENHDRLRTGVLFLLDQLDTAGVG
jgi:PAS domain S-box-containing protein